MLEQVPSMGGSVFGISDRRTRQIPVDKFPYRIVFQRFEDRTAVVASPMRKSGRDIGWSRLPGVCDPTTQQPRDPATP